MRTCDAAFIVLYPADAPEPVQDAWAALDRIGKLAVRAHGAVKAAKNTLVAAEREDVQAIAAATREGKTMKDLQANRRKRLEVIAGHKGSNRVNFAPISPRAAKSSTQLLQSERS